MTLYRGNTGCYCYAINRRILLLLWPLANESGASGAKVLGKMLESNDFFEGSRSAIELVVLLSAVACYCQL